MMNTNVGFTRNTCFDDDFRSGRFVVRFEPLIEENAADQGAEIVNQNFLTGDERLLKLLFSSKTNLSHKYTTMKELVMKWNHFRDRFQREIVGRNSRGAALSRAEILQILLDIAQEKTGSTITRAYPRDVSWFFAQLVLGDVDTFVRAVKPAGLITSLTELPGLTTGTVGEGGQNDLYDLVDPSSYICDVHLRRDRSCEGKSIFLIAVPKQDPPLALENFRGLELKVIITDSSLQQVVRQTVADVPVESPRFAVAHLGQCFSRTLAHASFGGWKLYDARLLSRSIEALLPHVPDERPAPLKRIRLLV
ncbi:ORF53 [Ictalurid herpesvirus 1]|nr:ORF53 [Ictalurid herpesvirus 1]